MNTVKYNKAKLYYMDLNALYNNSENAFELLDKNLLNIINSESSLNL